MQKGFAFHTFAKWTNDSHCDWAAAALCACLWNHIIKGDPGHANNSVIYFYTDSKYELERKNWTTQTIQSVTQDSVDTKITSDVLSHALQ